MFLFERCKSQKKRKGIRTVVPLSRLRTPEESDDSQVKEAECWADSYDGVQFYSCSAGESLAQSQVILRKC